VGLVLSALVEYGEACEGEPVDARPHGPRGQGMQMRNRLCLAFLSGHGARSWSVGTLRSGRSHAQGFRPVRGPSGRSGLWRSGIARAQGEGVGV